MNPEDVLKQVGGEVSVCTRCQLHYSRKNAVPGEGPPNAEIMFIGEGPGFYENEQGRPFVGQAGKFLDELLAGAGFERADVFITNVVKCRPPGNRDPLPEELDACAGFLERQVQAINPRVIVTLGRVSMAKFFGAAKISAVHGQARKVRGRLVVAMYHPAAALHQPSLRPVVQRDFVALPQYVQQARQMPPVNGEAAADAPLAMTAEQVSLLDQPQFPLAAPPAEPLPGDESESPVDPQQLSLF
ncbi:MAG: uracil-DNA glycosylase [Anaerolineae bacterium]|nr:uracil-DNA glycosylase [Anaerolineae bacterium]